MKVMNPNRIGLQMRSVKELGYYLYDLYLITKMNKKEKPEETGMVAQAFNPNSHRGRRISSSRSGTHHVPGQQGEEGRETQRLFKTPRRKSTR